jgi:hypothetical protein
MSVTSGRLVRTTTRLTLKCARNEKRGLELIGEMMGLQFLGVWVQVPSSIIWGEYVGSRLIQIHAVDHVLRGS